jgi:sialate O-acetylesterase
MRDAARAKLAADPQARVGASEAGATALYNATIHPFRFAKLKGVLWYQGEANTRSKRDYRPVLKTFVQSWREVFGQSDLPFIIVQLPNFGLPKDDGWMRVQEAQQLVAQEMKLALVVTIDQGSATTIHPTNKAEVGRRAGLAALQHVYKQDIEGTSPLLKSVQFQGDSAIVEFDGFKGDLQVRGDAIKGFELAGADHKFVPAEAKLDGRRIIVRANGVLQPKAVRYLWANSPEAVTLYSAAGLPAAPFRFGD